MTDLAHYMGNDLAVGPTGDVGIATGSTATQQRILRRLLTNPGDYIWQPAYGAGLGSMVGQPANIPRIKAIILAQMRQEAGVARDPAPTVDVTALPNGTVFCYIRYTDVLTGDVQVLQFPVS